MMDQQPPDPTTTVAGAIASADKLLTQIRDAAKNGDGTAKRWLDSLCPKAPEKNGDDPVKALVAELNAGDRPRKRPRKLATKKKPKALKSLLGQKKSAKGGKGKSGGGGGGG